VLQLIKFIFVSIRNLEAYELIPGQEVCAANTVTRYQGQKPCVSSCTFIPEVEATMMICAIDDVVDLANMKPGFANGDIGKLYTWWSVVHIPLCCFEIVFFNLFS
jgi:hypothetical protein